MQNSIKSLKQRVFWPEFTEREEQEILTNNSQFDLEEVLETLTREKQKK